MSEKRSKQKGGAIGSALIILKNFIKKTAKTKAGKVLKVALLVLAFSVGSFFVGRKTVNMEPLPPEIIYEPGEPVIITKYEPKPYKVRVPADTANIILDCVKSGKFSDLFPVNVKDSIVYLSKEDTMAVIKDWATERIYAEKVFDADTVGSATMEAVVRYNRLQKFTTTFIPTQKTTTITNYVYKKYAPFAGVGVTTMPSYVVNAGMYFDDKYGASAMFQHDWVNKKVSVGLIATYKF